MNSPKTPLAVFLCAFCLTWAVRGTDLEMTDEVLPLYAAVSILDHGDADIPLVDIYHPDFYVTAQNGRFYPKFGPGQAFVLLPFAALGDRFSAKTDSPAARGRNIMRIALFFGSVAVSLIAVLAFCLWRHLGYSQHVSAASAILMIAATELLPYSRSLFGDLSCALLGFAAFCFIRMTPRGSLFAAAAGACLGLCVFVRPVTVLFLAPFTLYMALVWKRHGVVPHRIRQIVFALIPFALFGAALLAFNRHAYGSFFSTGYGSEMFLFDRPISSGVPHLLFSFEKGFFIYSPAVLLSVLFWRKFHRACPDESASAMIFSALYLYVYAGWYASSPGDELSYGQRFLLPVVPFACLAMPEALLAAGRAVQAKIAAAAFLFLSFTAQIAGCLQKGLAYRTWSAQFETAIPSWLGYLIQTVRASGPADIWWWKTGGVGLLSGFVLVVLACHFARLAIRRG